MASRDNDMANRLRCSAALIGVALAVAGGIIHRPTWMTLGACLAILGVVATFLLKCLIQRRASAKPPQVREPIGATPDAESPVTTETLVQRMLRQHRYALLLRPEIVANLAPDLVDAARAALERHMSLVPPGEILMGARFADGDRDEESNGEDRGSGVPVRVDAFLLDRFCVTNRQFQAFVDSGGYTEMALWESEIWPGVLDFVDQTGYPGPLYWRDGRCPLGLEDHPVVGVSWYEASAYARWCGKRLPTHPEWEKAASWPAQMSAANRPHRRFPWGDSLDRSKANLWLTGIGGTVPVQEFPEGVSVGGVYQLVGNVWEWTSTNFGAFTFLDDELILPSALKSVRGGAFDTYFENHATCQFESGEDPTARVHNIGFRCAVSLCDLCLEQERAADPDVHNVSEAAAFEVCP
jgi:iron(II)-dependent oxidoreductase